MLCKLYNHLEFYKSLIFRRQKHACHCKMTTKQHPIHICYACLHITISWVANWINVCMCVCMSHYYFWIASIAASMSVCQSHQSVWIIPFFFFWKKARIYFEINFFIICVAPFSIPCKTIISNAQLVQLSSSIVVGFNGQHFQCFTFFVPFAFWKNAACFGSFVLPKCWFLPRFTQKTLTFAFISGGSSSSKSKNNNICIVIVVVVGAMAILHWYFNEFNVGQLVYRFHSVSRVALRCLSSSMAQWMHL